MTSATVLHIEGMSCGHCLNAVNRALSALPGVTLEQVQIGRAAVRHDPAVTDAAALVRAVEEAGFKAVTRER